MAIEVALQTMLATTGELVALSALLSILSFAWRHFLRPSKDLRKYGKWAVVTGATDGIGKAYAFELARKGLSVLIISRTQSKLDATAEEIRSKHSGIEVRTLAIDFSSFGAPKDPLRAKVAAAIDGVDVGVLINNVGASRRTTLSLAPTKPTRPPQARRTPTPSTSTSSPTTRSRSSYGSTSTRRRG